MSSHVTYISQLAGRASDVWCWLFWEWWQAWLLFVIGVQIISFIGVGSWGIPMSTELKLNFIEEAPQTAVYQYWKIWYTAEKQQITS